MTDFPRLHLTTEPRPLVELAPPEPGVEPLDLTEAQRGMIFVDVIHDGDFVPREFLIDRDGGPIDEASLRSDFVRERDWGASFVAERLAARLGLASWARVNVARVLMDFGRFPGSTPRHADHLGRFAINYPFSRLLSLRQKRRLLETTYDGVSDALEAGLRGKLIKIAIHTYDRFNQSGTERPSTSLMTRSIGYQTSSEMPAGIFDPLYPDILAEFTSDRILRDRISLTLEKAQIPVAHNYPYCLPEGSLEVRYQVWAWFHALRRFFEAAHPQTRDDPAYGRVWAMLLDTNLRSTDSEALRSHLHLFRRAPAGHEEAFARAAEAYEHLCRFCAEPRGRDFVERYRFSPTRTSSIAIEVRKDLLCELAADGTPIAIRRDFVHFVADTLAEAVAVYLREDRVATAAPIPELERHMPWYVAPRE